MIDQESCNFNNQHYLKFAWKTLPFPGLSLRLLLRPDVDGQPVARLDGGHARL